MVRKTTGSGKLLGSRRPSSRRRGDGTPGRSVDPQQGRSRGQPRPGRRAQTYRRTRVPGKSTGAIEIGGSGRRSDDGRDNSILQERRTRGPRWSWQPPEAGCADKATCNGKKAGNMTKALSNRRIVETPRREAVLGQTHWTACERGCRKRGLWPDEDPASPSQERRSATPDLRLCAPVLYSTVDILAAYIRYVSFYFNMLHHYETLATRSAYGPIAHHVRPRRHLLSAAGSRAEMRSRFKRWAEMTGTKRAAAGPGR